MLRLFHYRGVSSLTGIVQFTISYLQTFFLFSVISSPPSMNSVSSDTFSVLAFRSRRGSGAVRPVEDILSYPLT